MADKQKDQTDTDSIPAIGLGLFATLAGATLGFCAKVAIGTIVAITVARAMGVAF